ncbi:voltage-gated potassium channel [Neocallimastix lanati (nom. inval.)]|nr:voltage-gated potassium channel [Neocallimastix sp. JGI-2020a]
MKNMARNSINRYNETGESNTKSLTRSSIHEENDNMKNMNDNKIKNNNENQERSYREEEINSKNKGKKHKNKGKVESVNGIDSSSYIYTDDNTESDNINSIGNDNESEIKIEIDSRSFTESNNESYMDGSNISNRGKDVIIDIDDSIDKEGDESDKEHKDKNSKSENSLLKFEKAKGFRARLFQIIEVGKTGDTVSIIYDIFIITTIVVSLIPLTCKTSYSIFDYLDATVTVIFIIDYIFRFITADFKSENKTYVAFIKYPFTPWAIIDLLSILPSLTFFYSGLRLLKIFNLIKTLRIVRAIKAFRYSKSIIIISDVIKNSRNPLIAVGGLALGYILISALIIFNVEGESFETFFSAIYWATVSLTTVGYGDLYPHTTEGRIIAMISSVCGIALVALPAGIITAGYMDSLNDLNKKKERLRKAKKLMKEKKRREKKEKKRRKKEKKNELKRKRKEKIKE